MAIYFRTLNGMAMGKRPSARQATPMWVNREDLPKSSGHPFFVRLNRILTESGFDAFVERLCSRPSSSPRSCGSTGSRRLLVPIGDIPPAEFEALYYAQIKVA